MLLDILADRKMLRSATCDQLKDGIVQLKWSQYERIVELASQNAAAEADVEDAAIDLLLAEAAFRQPCV